MRANVYSHRNVTHAKKRGGLSDLYLDHL